MSLLVAACSSGGTASQSALTKPVPKAKTSLTVWSFLPQNYPKGTVAYNEVVQAFEKKYPQVTVHLDSMSYGTYFSKVRNATVARTGPDVVTMYGGAQAYSYRNGLFPLQDAMQPQVKQNLEFVADNYSKDGNLYILPTGTYGYALVVNQAKFRQAGIDPKTGLKDWSSFLNTCKQLSAKGIQPIAAGWKDGYLFETFMYMMSSQLMDTATLKKWTQGQIPVDNTIFTTATNDILAMNKAGCFGGSSSLGLNMYDDSFNQYYAGKTAMLATGSLSTAATAYQHVPSSTMMPLPQVPGSKYTNLIDAGAEAGWSVTKWTKSPEAAGAFVNFLAGPQAQQILWHTVGVPPNLKNITVQPQTAIQKSYLPLLENPVNHTGFAAYPLTVLAVYERNAAPLIGGTMTEQDFTQQAQSAFQQSH
ncbi:MAG: ABC transporter substrate-binding protein [Nocardioidaceae bacterium]